MRLSLAALAALPPKVARPRYDVAAATRGIVHIGVGNFHRAHQAIYVDDALAAGESGWAITGVSLRSAATRDVLTPQDGLYSVIERDGTAARARVIGALREVLVAPERPRAVIDRIADPSTRIVTITVTEKGYCHDPSTRGLALEHPDVVHDLANRDHPRGLLGLLAAGLAARQARGHAGLTVLSCDNLAGNGALLAGVVHQFAQTAGYARALSAWIGDHVSFPNAMVDRIVPHTTQAARDLAREALGVDDAWPIAIEPFTQWVIEDRFALGRPEWERSGVQFVSDVAPYETMKLSLLNAAHSCIAYLGYPAGLTTVDAAIAAPAIRRFVIELWRTEIAPTLDATLQHAISAYCEQLLARFANSALAHQTRQIAMDGSQKIPMRILPALRARIAAGQSYPLLALAIAAWIRYLTGRTERGEPYTIDDPQAAALAVAIDAGGADPGHIVRNILTIESIFGRDLAHHSGVRATVSDWLRRLLERGSLGTLA
jgi:fructuronate reductase